MKRIALLAFGASIALAQTPELPRIGWLADDAGQVRSVDGLAGNFLLSDPDGTTASAIACGEPACLMQTDAGLLLRARSGEELSRWTDLSGRALLAIDSRGKSALRYDLTAGALQVWRGGEWNAAAAPDGDLTAVALDTGGAYFLIQRDGVLWRQHRATPEGPVDEEIAMTGITAPAVVTGSGAVVWADDAGVHVRWSDHEDVVAVGGPVQSFAFITSSWIHLQGAAPSLRWALRLNASGSQLFQLPGDATGGQQ